MLERAARLNAFVIIIICADVIIAATGAPAPGACGVASACATTSVAESATAHAAEERFLLFSVADYEQLNKQRRGLLYYMRLARQLGRTLVLPRAHQLRKDKRAWTRGQEAMRATWNAPGALTYIPMSGAYNLSRLYEYVPVRELACHWQLAQGGEKASVAVGAPERRVDLLFEHGACSAGAELPVTFNGVGGVIAGEVQCGQSSEAALVALAHVRSIGFAHSHDQLPEADARELAPHVRFIEPIYDEAARFAAAAFGGEPFLAVHWRRADFQLARAARPDVLLSAAELIDAVERALAERGLRHVYLATDATEEADLELLRARLDVRRYSWIANADETDMQRAMDVANIEVAICALASFFLGTVTSNLSLTVREERRARGLGDDAHDVLALIDG
jgi:hypothetical protein